MIPYILYVSLILTACFIFYKLLLQKETFFYLNRFVLLACMLLAFILPVLHVPQQMSFRKAPALVNITSTEPTLITRPLEANVPATISKPAQKNQVINFEQVMQWLIYLYWFGVAIFGLNFLMQAIVLLYKAYTRPVIIDGKFRIVEITGDKAPCSFGNNIFINPEKYDWLTYNQVLLHEKIHIAQKHTLDLLLAEIVLIFQWFNPFAWLWRKELESNLEFFTDNKLLQHDSVQKESYQLSLLKVAAPHFPLSLTTNYNQSLLKKRLLMMNSKKSNVHTIWKYFFLLPLMVLFVCLFNEPIVNSQSVSVKAKPKVHPHVDNDIKTEGNWFATIKGDKIDIQFKNTDENNSSNGNSFLLSEFKDLPRDKPGTFSLTREAGTMEFKGKFDGDKGMGEYKFSPNKSYSADMQKEGIDLTEDKDVMVFFLVNVKHSYVQMLKKNGYTDLDKDKVIPLAALDVNEEYITSIKQAGFTDIGLDNLIPFRALGVTKAYIDDIRKSGYKDVTPDKIITFKAQGIDGKYIADFRSSTKTNKNDLTNDELEVLANIKDQELNENNNKNQDLNKKGLTNDELEVLEKSIKGQEMNETNSKNQDLNKNKNKNKNQGLNNNLNRDKNKDTDSDEDDIIAFKAMNIDKAYVNSFKAVGYNNLSNSDLISMKALGVTPEYVKSFRDAGYANLSADDLFSLKSQNVTPGLMKQYKNLGFIDIGIQDVISMKALGVTPEYIKSFRDAGYTNIKVNELVSLKSQNVTPSLIKQYKDLGFNNVSLDDVVGAKATGTSPSFIKSMREKGHNMKSLDKYIAMRSILGE